MGELGQQGEIVLKRSSRLDALKTLSLKPDGNYTKATLLRVGQALDAGAAVDDRDAAGRIRRE